MCTACCTSNAYTFTTSAIADFFDFRHTLFDHSINDIACTDFYSKSSYYSDWQCDNSNDIY